MQNKALYHITYIQTREDVLIVISLHLIKKIYILYWGIAN